MSEFVIIMTGANGGRIVGQEKRFTRHVPSCPETEYGVRINLNDPTLELLAIVDCRCCSSPVATGDRPPPSSTGALVPPAAVQESHGGGQDDRPQQDTPGWRAALNGYTGTFEFLVNMKDKARDPNWTPTDRQLASIEKSLAREGNPPQREEQSAGGIQLDPLADARYAVQQPDGNYLAFILTTGNGKWEGWRFVRCKQLPDGEASGNIGNQKPGKPYSGQRQAELVTILSDPEGAMQNYYEQTGICPLCFKREHDEWCKWA